MVHDDLSDIQVEGAVRSYFDDFMPAAPAPGEWIPPAASVHPSVLIVGFGVIVAGVVGVVVLAAVFGTGPIFVGGGLGSQSPSPSILSSPPPTSPEVTPSPTQTRTSSPASTAGSPTPGSGLTEAEAVAVAQSHVAPPGDLVSAEQGGLGDFVEPGILPNEPRDRPVWAVVLTSIIDMECPAPPATIECPTPHQGEVLVVLDYFSGDFITSSAPPPS
jgi:hypothetical protein